MAGNQLIPEITSALAAFTSDPTPYVLSGDELELRKLAAELQLLPVILDMGGCLGLRPNGDVMSFVWDEPRHLRPERDPRICNTVYYRASVKYPELAALAPKRPATAIDCPHCDGTGSVSWLPNADLANTIVCYCGGLGWLPGN